VLAEFLAEDLAARIRTPGLTMMEVRQVNGMADRLMCTVTRMERALERRQARVMPFRDTKAVDGFDLDALEVVWRRGMPGLDAADPGASAGASAVQQPTAPEPAVVLDPMKREPMGRGPMGREPGGLGLAEPAVAAVPGRVAAGHERLGSGPTVDAGTMEARNVASRAGVTVEQGDGWSLEVWPAGAGARVGLEHAADDRAARDAKGAAGGLGGGRARRGAA
jgi:hypothetical protein